LHSPHQSDRVSRNTRTRTANWKLAPKKSHVERIHPMRRGRDTNRRPVRSFRAASERIAFSTTTARLYSRMIDLVASWQRNE
jgi:hypothetical protein